MASSMKRAQTFSSPQDGTRPRVPMRNQTMRLVIVGIWVTFDLFRPLYSRSLKTFPNFWFSKTRNPLKVTITSLFQREAPRNGDYYNLNQPVPRNRMSTASSTMSAADRHYINDEMSKPASQFDKKVAKIHAYFQNDQNVNDLERRMSGFHHVHTILEDGYKGTNQQYFELPHPWSTNDCFQGFFHISDQQLCQGQ